MGGYQPEFNKIKVNKVAFPLFFLPFRMDRFTQAWLHASLSRGIQYWNPLEREEHVLVYSKFLIRCLIFIIEKYRIMNVEY